MTRRLKDHHLTLGFLRQKAKQDMWTKTVKKDNPLVYLTLSLTIHGFSSCLNCSVLIIQNRIKPRSLNKYKAQPSAK